MISHVARAHHAPRPVHEDLGLPGRDVVHLGGMVVMRVELGTGRHLADPEREAAGGCETRRDEGAPANRGLLTLPRRVVLPGTLALGGVEGALGPLFPWRSSSRSTCRTSR